MYQDTIQSGHKIPQALGPLHGLPLLARWPNGRLLHGHRGLQGPQGTGKWRGPAHSGMLLPAGGAASGMATPEPGAGRRRGQEGRGEAAGADALRCREIQLRMQEEHGGFGGEEDIQGYGCSEGRDGIDDRLMLLMRYTLIFIYSRPLINCLKKNKLSVIF